MVHERPACLVWGEVLEKPEKAPQRPLCKQRRIQKEEAARMESKRQRPVLPPAKFERSLGFLMHSKCVHVHAHH